MTILPVAVIVLGVGLLLLGLVGVLRPLRVAESLAWAPDGPAGAVAIRTLIGAPYLAMGVMTLGAVAFQQWAWLAPIAAIEAAMALIRFVSIFTDGFKAARLPMLFAEIVATLVLSQGALQHG